MPRTREPTAGVSGPPRIATLTEDELARVAGAHLTELADHERRTSSARKATSLPRARRLGRAITLGGLSIGGTFASAWRWVWSPRRPLGRVWARLRLLSPTKTFGPWTLLLLAFAGSMAYLRFGPLEGDGHEPWQTISWLLGGGALVALLFALWNDLVRLPFLAWRIRRRVIRRPERVLLPNLLAQQAPRQIQPIAFSFVPRTALYDELLPGVLARDRKDVQIVVGEAGAGKTTALLGIAQLLARTGIVSVVVPLRPNERSELALQAKARFKEQVDAAVRSDGESELLWRWLVRRRRAAVLVDDIDQVGPDGERGLVLRKMLEDAGAAGVPVVVTARPAGVPAGVAASAINLGPLAERDAVDHVLAAAHGDPSFGAGAPPSRRLIGEWVAAGKLAQAPFYLELLAQLAAVEQCPPLPHAGSMWASSEDHGRVRRDADGEHRWNELWVRYLLLEHFYEQTVRGRVRRSLGIEPRERESTLGALEQAALGTLVATSLAAHASLAPRAGADCDARRAGPLRRGIRDFVDTDDRASLGDGDATVRRQVSAYEVIDAGERLSILERDADGDSRFRHRIMQAYLAARCLARREREAGEADRPNPLYRPAEGERDWIAALLDHHHPEKLSAHMTLTFAALRAHEVAQAHRHDAQAHGHEAGPAEQHAHAAGPVDAPAGDVVTERILKRLVKGAKDSRKGHYPGEEERREVEQTVVTLATEAEGRALLLSVALPPQTPPTAPASGRQGAGLDPLRKPDPEQRTDPDDALMKLTTAAEIVCAIPGAARSSSGVDWRQRIVEEVGEAAGATRWTKLRAIDALVAFEDDERRQRISLEDDERWQRIWEFARDPDYDVRRAASSALEHNAYEAFKSLADGIERLIAKAAARSANGYWLMRPERHLGPAAGNGGGAAPAAPERRADGAQPCDITIWKVDEDIRALEALGWILPAIVSGFREDPSVELETDWAESERRSHADDASADGDEEVSCHPLESRPYRRDYARRARRALEEFVALAFEGGHGNLEAAVAQGFKSDALRHAQHPDRGVTGPGWVTCNRELVAGVCLDHARYWYARMALYQALALYAIAGADARDTLDVFARHLHRGGRDRHPFTQRAARLARAAVRRHELRNGRWLAYVWGDEGKDTGRRATQLSHAAAQLVGDITVLLNLNESSPEDRQDAFVQMQELPHCLSRSRDRAEILGGGCPSTCGWGLCPYHQPPPDEPSAHRGVSRAFCRQQREIAWHRKPRWQRAIRRTKLREFWREMEYRART